MATKLSPIFQLASILIISIILSSLFFSLQASAKTTDWSKTYPNINGKSNCLIAVDGGYVFTGVSNGCFLLAKTDLSGELLWCKTYQTGEATCVIQTSDGGYAMAGQGDVNFIKADSSGNIQWSKSYTYSNDTYKITTFRINSIAPTPDDGFILAGKTPSGFILGWDYTMKIDKDGNVLWGKTYGKDYGNSVATDVIAVDDGYVLAIDALLKINQNGDVLWRKPISIADSLAKTGDGGLLMIVPNRQSGDRELIKTNSEGNTLWSKTYRDEIAVETHLRMAIETSEGGILLCAWVYPEWESVVWLIKTDSDGNHLWNLTSSIVYNYNSRAYSIIEANNGEFVYSGAIVNVFRSNETQIWLAKTSTPDRTPTITPAPTLLTPTPPIPTPITPTPTLIVDPPHPYMQSIVILAVVVAVSFSAVLYVKVKKTKQFDS
jgi:hypothetical protein